MLGEVRTLFPGNVSRTLPSHRRLALFPAFPSRSVPGLVPGKYVKIDVPILSSLLNLALTLKRAFAQTHERRRIYWFFRVCCSTRRFSFFSLLRHWNSSCDLNTFLLETNWNHSQWLMDSSLSTTLFRSSSTLNSLQIKIQSSPSTSVSSLSELSPISSEIVANSPSASSSSTVDLNDVILAGEWAWRKKTNKRLMESVWRRLKILKSLSSI